MTKFEEEVSSWSQERLEMTSEEVIEMHKKIDEYIKQLNSEIPTCRYWLGRTEKKNIECELCKQSKEIIKDWRCSEYFDFDGGRICSPTRFDVEKPVEDNEDD